MNLDTDKLSKIFSFWKDIEILTPFEVSDETFCEIGFQSDVSVPPSALFKWSKDCRVDAASLDRLLTELPHEEDCCEYFRVFTLCFGIVPTREYIRRVLELLRKTRPKLARNFVDVGFEERASDGYICLASAKYNHFGKLVLFQPSYALAFLVWATREIKGEENNPGVDQTLEILRAEFSERFVKKTNCISSITIPPMAKIIYRMLVKRVKHKDIPSGYKCLKDLGKAFPKFDSVLVDKVTEWLVNESGLRVKYCSWVSQIWQKAIHEEIYEWFNSPYVPVLTDFIEFFDEGKTDFLSPALTRFFGLAQGNPVRKDVLASPQNFYEIADPKYFNFGRWPTTLKASLVCMQQLAVSQICLADKYMPVVTVNGPPGTGKTMILKELIADIVVQRALILSQYHDITQANIFDSRSNNETGQTYVLKKELTDDFAILVASNNNAAVENITKELPYQYSYEGRQVDYFSTLANRLNKTKDAWGLISVALGRMKNWATLYKSLYGTKPGDSPFANALKGLSEEYGGNKGIRARWIEERKNFLTLLNEVRNLLKAQRTQYLEDKKVADRYEPIEQGRIARLFERSDLQKKPYFDFSSQNNLDRHLDPIYWSGELDEKRTELFLSALELHKLAILAFARNFVLSLRSVIKVLSQGCNLPFQMQYLGTLCFLIPVVSTTFASSVLRFGAYRTGIIPWLLIDEASQASPQSAICLMQKAKRVVVVGDPAQLQPVIPLPVEVTNLLSGEDGELLKWSPYNTSLQILADGTSDYGAWVGDPESGGRWSGLPLRAQRRSYSPMFNISNAISYDGQMVLAKEFRDKEKRKGHIPSFWLNVEPKVPSSTNVVEEEIDSTVLTLRYIRDELISKKRYGLVNSSKSIMICSPYRAVVWALRRVVFGNLRKNLLYSVVNIGTAHTMQGRQADIVILVLGSKTGQKGYGARSWASNPPNLMNVMVSRARETLIVVGNLVDWGQQPVVNEILFQLQDKANGIMKFDSEGLLIPQNFKVKD